MKRCVAVHGCHVEAEGWGNIIWGDPKNNYLGRVAKGIDLALSIGAEYISIGTGASERD